MLRRRTAIAALLALTAAGGATAAFVLPAAPRGTAALVTVPRDTGDAVLPATAPSPTATPEASPTAQATTPPPATRTAASRPAATPSPTDAPPAARPAKPPAPTASPEPDWITNYGPRDAHSVTVPYRKGQTSWDVTADGIRFLVSMTPAKVGVPMTWTVEARSGEDGCCNIQLHFGDSYYAGDTTCQDFDSTKTFEHTYNKAGPTEFMLASGTRERCDDPMHSRYSTVFGAFDIAPGKATAQGPSLPEISLLDVSDPVEGHEGDRRWTSLFAEAKDADGFITWIDVDWGDGTVTRYPGDPHGCRPSLGGWPVPSIAWLPSEPPAVHHYAVGGTYRITATTYSTGCDGTQEQSGSRSMLYRA